MPRTARVAPGGLVYHVLNRAVARLPLFQKPGDFESFERILAEAQQRFPTRILSYCLMPNHWHFVLWPREDGRVDGDRSSARRITVRFNGSDRSRSCRRLDRFGATAPQSIPS